MNDKTPPQNSAQAWMALIAQRRTESRVHVSDLWPDLITLRMSGADDYSGETHSFGLTLEEATEMAWLLNCAVMAADKMHGEGGEV